MCNMYIYSSQPVAQYTHATGLKFTLPNTDQAHDKRM
jgi:hypothetical protein